MSFLLGAALLSAGFVLILLARGATARAGGRSWPRDFAGGDLAALAITTVLIFGFAFLGSGLSSMLVA